MQIRYSRSIEHHAKNFQRLWQLEDYTDTTKPTIFYGFFFTSDWNACLAHKGIKFALWAGSDALGLDRVKRLCADKNCWHISISRYIYNDLSIHTDRIINLPGKLNTDVRLWEPCLLGEKIYWFNSNEKKYGSEYKPALIKKFGKDRFLFLNQGDVVKKDMMRYHYSLCRGGVRLTRHEGCSNTVVELGLMGRKVVHNGSLPNCLPYTQGNIDSIARQIDNLLSVNYDYQTVAGAMRATLNFDFIEVLKPFL